MSNLVDNPLECLDRHKGCCKGKIEYRHPLSPTGTPFPRCDFHWDARLRFQEEHNRKYPVLQPADFDPMDAGERWDEEY